MYVLVRGLIDTYDPNPLPQDHSITDLNGHSVSESSRACDVEMVMQGVGCGK
jgi:hypothetical protein